MTRAPLLTRRCARPPAADGSCRDRPPNGRKADKRRASRRCRGRPRAWRREKASSIRPPDLEGREGQPPIEGRAGQSVANGRRRRRAVGPRRSAGRRSLPGRTTWARPSREAANSVGGPLTGSGRAEQRTKISDLRHRADFGVQRRGDMPDIVRVDPALEEARRNGKPSLPGHHRHQSETPEPAVEDIVADFRPQALAATAPRLGERRTAGPALIDAIRIGFVKDIHGRSSGVKVDSRNCGDANRTERRLTLYVCAQGNPPAFHPPTTPLRRKPSSGPSNPSDTLKQGAHPALVIATAAWREAHPGAAQEHERRAALDRSRTSAALASGQRNRRRPPSKDSSAIPRRTASCRAPECLACRHRPTRPWSGRRSETADASPSSSA